MAGYIGSKTSVTQVDGYNRTEADAEFVSKDGDTITTAAGTALTLDRTGSDGTVFDLKKDGSTVGSIGTVGSDIVIGSGNTGIRFYEADNSILPSSTAGQASNGTLDIGDGSFRFKDLYLSGGVYLGGTGSANKLDDYEEGTWTPVDSSGASLTFSSVVGPTYTKIGRIVIVNVELTFPTTSDTNRVSVGGFPFTIASPSAHGGFIRYSNQSDRPHILANPSSSRMVLYSQAGDLFSNNQLSGKRFDFTVIYHTT